MGGTESVEKAHSDISKDTVPLVGKSLHPKGTQKDQVYGTSGFRDKADVLDHVFFRMGVLAALRGKALIGFNGYKSPPYVGVMVTASHNPEEDNGAKICEKYGEMLDPSWEGYATEIANAKDDELQKVVEKIIAEEKIVMDSFGTVFIGRDTRKSSAAAALAVADGVSTIYGTSAVLLGLTTTPQLHFVTRTSNDRQRYGHPSLIGYNLKLSGAFNKLFKAAPTPKVYKPSLVVDCANGVGGAALKAMMDLVEGLDVTVVNTGEGPLNSGCGADHVKMTQAPPAGSAGKSGRMVTFDGDADRVMYFFTDSKGFHLLDGDRIALLCCHFITEQAKAAGIVGKLELGIGCAQTAYANGAATAFAEKVLGKDKVFCCKTGVKNLHPVAEKKLDCGVYAESNGHGNILFNAGILEQARAVVEKKPSPEKAEAAQRLLDFRDLINESVGDAISLMLAVEVVLKYLDWDCEKWLEMYEDLPYRQVKVVVKDRYIFETTDAERKCVKPAGLQDKIDKLVAAAPSGRSFVRPSGTEDVVRVYAEAATLDEMLKLCQGVVDAVYADAGGIGNKPTVK